jgi:transcriptional regulator with XRE-family HTH domain
MSVFKDILVELRKDKHMTQPQVADALQISRSTLANWEQGRREPDIDGIIMLAKYFDVTCGQLLGTEPI